MHSSSLCVSYQIFPKAGQSKAHQISPAIASAVRVGRGEGEVQAAALTVVCHMYNGLCVGLNKGLLYCIVLYCIHGGGGRRRSPHPLRRWRSSRTRRTPRRSRGDWRLGRSSPRGPPARTSPSAPGRSPPAEPSGGNCKAYGQLVSHTATPAWRGDTLQSSQVNIACLTFQLLQYIIRNTIT